MVKHPHNFIDISGNRYNSLTAIRYSHSDRDGKSKWVFKCDCGKEHIAYTSHVKRGKTKSCGCLGRKLSAKRQYKHGKLNHKLYRIWRAMLDRCYRKNCPTYRYYGMRGISVVDVWINDFSSFFEFCISNGWKDGLEIDRVNNDGNYCPGNIRFVTKKENLNNRRNSKYWFVMGMVFNSANDAAIYHKTTRWKIYSLCMDSTVTNCWVENKRNRWGVKK